MLPHCGAGQGQAGGQWAGLAAGRDPRPRAADAHQRRCVPVGGRGPRRRAGVAGAEDSSGHDAARTPRGGALLGGPGPRGPRLHSAGPPPSWPSCCAALRSAPFQACVQLVPTCGRGPLAFSARPRSTPRAPRHRRLRTAALCAPCVCASPPSPPTQGVQCAAIPDQREIRVTHGGCGALGFCALLAAMLYVWLAVSGVALLAPSSHNLSGLSGQPAQGSLPVRLCKNSAQPTFWTRPLSHHRTPLTPRSLGSRPPNGWPLCWFT